MTGNNRNNQNRNRTGENKINNSRQKNGQRKRNGGNGKPFAKREYKFNVHDLRKKSSYSRK